MFCTILYEYFNQVGFDKLNMYNVITDDISSASTACITGAVKHMKPGKSVGFDSLTSDYLKHGSPL